MLPRNASQASKTGDDTKIGQQNIIPSMDDLACDLGLKLMLFSLFMALYCFNKENIHYLHMCFVGVCCLYMYYGFQSFQVQSKLVDEISRLKEELQNKSSERPRLEGEQKAQDTKEPEPRKDLMKDQAVTNCVEVGRRTEVTQESKKPKKEGKLKVEAEAISQETKQKSMEHWKYCLGFAEKGYKHPFKNPVCGAAKFRTFYVGNLSFKAKAKDIQQAFEKQLSMKVDSFVVARDSTGKSRGCAFVTMRWKEFQERNPGYDRDKEPANQEKLWADRLVNIMNQEDVCGRKVYVELARSQRRG